MRKCLECGNSIPLKLRIEDKIYNLSSRKRCLDCLPFKSGRWKTKNTKKYIYSEAKRKAWTRNTTNRRREFSRKAIKYKGGACQICGYNKCDRALDFHHIDPSTKLFSIANCSYRYSWDKVEAELDKCLLLCANCHREVECGCAIVADEVLAIA